MADDSLLSRCEVVARILIRSSHSHESHNIPPCIIRLYWSTCQLINKHHHLLLPLHQLHLGRCHLISAMGEITPRNTVLVRFMEKLTIIFHFYYLCIHIHKIALANFFGKSQKQTIIFWIFSTLLHPIEIKWPLHFILVIK